MVAYRWVIEILRPTGELIGREPVEPDFSPVLEAGRLAYLRLHGPPAAAEFDRPMTIEPVWQSKLGEPYVAALRVAANGNTEFDEVPISVFRQTASRASSDYVARGLLKEGDAFIYLVTAYRHDGAPQTVGARRFSVTAAPAPAPRERRWTEAIGGEVEPGSDQPRLALPRQVLAEVTDCTRGTPGVETGGILIGHLRWDPEARDLFVEVTAQIHARWAVGTETRLHFSAANWTEVRSIVALRKQGESVLGWWHSHPVASWCRQCPEERQRVCPLQAGFLSEEDSTLHRACFPRAYTAALVCSDVADGEVRFAMFGWHGGQLGRRGYHIHGGELPPAWIGPVVDDGRKASEKRGEACVPK